MAGTGPCREAATGLSTVGAKDDKSLQIGEDALESGLRKYQGGPKGRPLVQTEEQEMGSEESLGTDVRALASGHVSGPLF